MPVFKFSVPVSSGEILVGLDASGSATWLETGDISVSGRVVVIGMQTCERGSGSVVVNLLSISGMSEDMGCVGGISARCDILGYSTGARARLGSGSALLYPTSDISLSGAAILNGIGNGDVSFRFGVSLAGRQGSMVMVGVSPSIRGFGARRVCCCDIESNIVTVSGVARKEVDARPGARGSIRVRPSLVFGMAWRESVRDMYCSGSIIIGGAVLTGFCTLGLSESDDLALKYEDRRRRL